MNKGTLFWLITFGISGTTFFVIAAVVCFKGFADFRELLRHSSTPGTVNRGDDKLDQ